MKVPIKIIPTGAESLCELSLFTRTPSCLKLHILWLLESVGWEQTADQQLGSPRRASFCLRCWGCVFVFQLQPRAAAVCSPCDQQGAQSRRQGVTMGGVLHWRTDGPSHCIHVSLCDQWSNQLSAGSALSGDLLFVFILKIRTFRCTAEKKKNETQHNTARNMVEGKQSSELQLNPEEKKLRLNLCLQSADHLSPYHKCTSM